MPHLARTIAGVRRHPGSSFVGHVANGPTRWYRAGPANAWQRFRLLRGRCSAADLLCLKSDLARSGFYSLPARQKHYLHFRRDKKEIPSRGVNLAIKSEGTERLDHAPVPRVGLTLQPGERRPFRHQDRTNLNFFWHEGLLPRTRLVGASSGLCKRCKPPGWTDPLPLAALRLVDFGSNCAQWFTSRTRAKKKFWQSGVKNS